MEILVDKQAALAITQGKPGCSGNCLNKDTYNYNFLDDARFEISGCVHFSQHLQCIVTRLLIQDECFTACPIRDTQQCRHAITDGKRGQARYWALIDYHTFFRALLRNKTLVDAFLKPEFR